MSLTKVPSSMTSFEGTTFNGEVRSYDSADQGNFVGGASGTANRIQIRGASHPNTPNVITMDTNGSEKLRIDSSGNLQFNSGYGSVATAYGCRAWVNFNGTGTVAIRASGNVSSITDNGTGDYTVNFSTAMPDANYCICGTASWDGTTLNNAHGMSIAPKNNNSGAISATSLNAITYYEGTGARFDPLFASLSIFR